MNAQDTKALNTKTINQITAFWLGSSLDSPELAAARREWWYRGGAAVDDDIRRRFGALLPKACNGELAAWLTTAEGALALILLLDQFTRNLYRSTPEAYVGDALAFDVVYEAIELNLDEELHPVARIWLYHPFHHAECVAQQDEGLALLNAVLQAAPPTWHAYVQRSIDGWTSHRDIVARFGRFPHRNKVLGRSSTAEERAFMDEDGNTYGQ
jgi:uncharacterized protein (DUF924 family)